MVLSLGIIGISGRMGQAVSKLISKDSSFVLIGGVRKNPKENSDSLSKDILSLAKKSDLLIDFSSPEALANVLKGAQKHKKPLLIGTTGYSKKQLSDIAKASQDIPILLSYNFSLGIALCQMLIKLSSDKLNDFSIEITETHHQNKKDKPSGTALMLAEDIFKKTKKETTINSIRSGDVIGKHVLSFFNNEEKIEISHEAFSREIFAKGALFCSKFLANKKAGLYSMADIF